MSIENITQKAQAALKAAQVKAIRYGHQEVDGEHLLLCLMEQDGGLVSGLLEKIGVDCSSFLARLEQELEGRARISGGSTESGKVYVTQRLNQLLVAAGDEAKKLKDEYVSVEHLLLAFIDEGKKSFSGKLLSEFGVKRKNLLEVLRQVRGNQRVTSDNPEGGYEALEKYGMDLVAYAKSGKLDPVIGRDSEIRSVVRILSRKTKNNPVLI